MASHVSTLDSRKRVRRTFGQLEEVTPMPNLIDVQRFSYDTFLQMEVATHERDDLGLQETFKSVFPIEDFAGRSVLEFVSYDLETPKYDVEECQQRGLTYASPLRVTLRLVVWEENEDTGSRSIRDIKEQDVYMGDMPLMTSNGTFIVNGTERVIVSQMHRSPGVFFDHDRGKTHASGKLLFAARVIPYRGSWLDFEFDAKDILNVRIDRKRKLPATTFMMALPDENSLTYLDKCAESGDAVDPSKVQGMSREEILSHFYKSIQYRRRGDGWAYDFDVEALKGNKLIRDLVDAKEDLGKIRTLLGCFGNIAHVGPLGAGHAMKALNNYVSAAGLLASMQALATAQSFSIHPKTFTKVINGSTGRNNTTEVKLEPFIIPRSYASGFSLQLMAKDVGIASELIINAGFDAPITGALNDYLVRAVEALDGDIDHTGLYEMVNPTKN